MKRIALILLVVLMLSGCVKWSADRNTLEGLEYVRSLQIADRTVVEFITLEGEKLNLYLEDNFNPMKTGEKYTVVFIDDKDKDFSHVNQKIDKIKIEE